MENTSLDDIVKQKSSQYADKIDELLQQETVPSSAVEQIHNIPRDTIMVVDDDNSQLLSIQKILSSDYKLVLCDRGRKAIETYEQEQEHIFTILLDIRLPDMDGFEVFKQLKEKNPNIPIIFITGYQSTYGDGFEIYKKYRPHGYIVKNHENEMNMIRDTLANAVDTYKRIIELEKSRTVTVRNKMMAGLMHDLKNMFTPILMIPDLIITLGEMQQTDKVNELIMNLKNSVDFYAANQQILFNYAKGENIRLNLSVYNIKKLFEEFLNMVRVQFEDKLEILTDYKYDGDIKTDKNILCCQVLLNIIKNAKEAFYGYGSGKGKVNIEVFRYDQYITQYGDRAKFDNRNNEDIVLVLSDNGPGIPKEVEDKMFEAYISYGKKEGTGLGTWMIRNGIVDLLKGEVVLVNKVGEGVSYHIWLPQSETLVSLN
ncbi:MAG: response regulator [Candidatus Margulisbacteria bacterium]|nr:response regulator [Candidatus Margulisiibacteriota bacterium]